MTTGPRTRKERRRDRTEAVADEAAWWGGCCCLDAVLGSVVALAVAYRLARRV